MGRDLTLRGTLETEMNLGSCGEAIAFVYESPDRSKGWRVKGAWLWLADIESQNTISANNNPVLFGALSTDQLPVPVRYSHISSVEDNRLFGWTSIHYRGFDANDYFVGHATVPSDQSFLLDLDRIVTNELYVYAGIMANGGFVSPLPVKINYLIALEEVKISPSQSILQQLKGIGQNITD